MLSRHGIPERALHIAWAPGIAGLETDRFGMFLKRRSAGIRREPREPY